MNNEIVFFDGVCGLCNSFVDFLLRIDKKKKLLFAPLQGKTAAEFQISAGSQDLKTVLFYSQGKLYSKSDAVIEIFKRLGGIWSISVAGRLIPQKIRNYIYDYVARNRLRWFGQKTTCRMPSENEKGRLLP